MGKFKALLKFLFLVIPFFVAGGVELILLRNRTIDNWTFVVSRIKKTKRKSDQQIFIEFMRRMTR